MHLHCTSMQHIKFPYFEGWSGHTVTSHDLQLTLLHAFIYLHLTQSFNTVNYFAIQSLHNPPRIRSRYFVKVATHSRQHAIHGNLIGTFNNSRPPQRQLVHMESVPKTIMLDQRWYTFEMDSRRFHHSYLLLQQHFRLTRRWDTFETDR